MLSLKTSGIPFDSSPRYVLHITYMERKMNTLICKPVCWRQQIPRQFSECLKIAQGTASVTITTVCVCGGLTENFNCTYLSLRTNKQILRFLSACLYNYCLWHMLSTHQKKWSVSDSLLNLLSNDLKGLWQWSQNKNDYFVWAPATINLAPWKGTNSRNTVLERMYTAILG